MLKPTVLITGASSGIGAVYAERFAQRGHNLVLVARDKARLTALAERLQRETAVSVDIIPADLTQSDDLAKVEARLRNDSSIGILINNAGIAQSGRFAEQTAASVEQLIALNVTALTRLSGAVTPRFIQAGDGAIVNVSSVVALAPEFAMTVYGATKAFVLFLSQGMDIELSSSGIYVQAVLPAGTYTEIWQRAGIELPAAEKLMTAEELVDAALVGFDRRERVTIPPLRNEARWNDLDAARQALLPDINQAEAARRYKPE